MTGDGMPASDAKPHAHDLRKGRVSMPGHFYCVTTVTLGREPVFSDFGSARLLVGALRETQSRNEAVTLAFVVMPDHLHWLIQLGVKMPLSKVVGTIKAVTAHRLGRRVWQGGFHDHALRQEEEMAGIGRYIVANPVRAGLVDRVGDYPHWDAVWL